MTQIDQNYDWRKARRRKRRIRSVVKRTVLNFLNRSNAYIVQRLPDWLEKHEPQLNELRDNWVAFDDDNNDSDFLRMIFILATIERLKEQKIPGAIAELGVFKGNTAKLFHRLDPARKLYLFDTFQGFAKRDVADDPARNGHDNFKNTSLEGVKKFIGDSKNVEFCPGFFPDTAVHIPNGESFALVHLDCDLYAPMAAGLKFFYQRLNPGGVMLIHDYQNTESWPGVKKAVDEFLADKNEGLIVLPDRSGTAAFVKSR